MGRFDTIETAAAALRSARATSEDLTQAALDRIAANTHLNAIAACDPDLALAEARERERDRSAPTGPLRGIPITIKDLFATAGLPTRAGTRAAGAVILAKTKRNGWSGSSPPELR